MLPEDLRYEVIAKLSDKFGYVEYDGFNFTSGGCINSTGRIKTSRGDFFIKWNRADSFPEMFKYEFEGLMKLLETRAIKIPEPYFHGEIGSHSYLLTEYIASLSRMPHYWQQLGRQLAEVHKNTWNWFGFENDNYIGSLPQENSTEDTWANFFIHKRLEAQLQFALDSGKLNTNNRLNFERLYKEIPSIFNDIEQPALIHGDLWSGNLMTGASGEPVLIDPSVYFGNREIEIAFTTLFGGFDSEFYESYEDVWPLEPGFDQRRDIYNLYPLLVHVNLFGGGYISQVEHIISRF